MKTLVIYLLATIIGSGLLAQNTVIQYLSGTDKDHTVKWDFMVNKGRNSEKWSTIPVPSCWEMQGFGSYNYSQDVQNPDEQGFYKYHFRLAPQHKGKTIVIVFDASMTDTDVKINGKSAGPIHQGGFYQFKFDITKLVQFDKYNLLEVSVSKKSSNASINRAERKADFWLFGGIYRPVYLEISPGNYIERVAINAKANGEFTVQPYIHTNNRQTVKAQVFDIKGYAVDKPFSLLSGDSVLHHHFKNIKPWNPEQPNLYNVVVSIYEGAKVVHSIKQRFGFRTAELREQDGFYVNGKKIIFKGVCRHSEWPETGRTLSRQVHLLDIKAMKDMNMNAVRMSHYPPDKEFLDLCDSLGLFVLDELTGWQAAYDTVVARKLVKELVIRDVNHPSIVIWDNGNEGGWNREVDKDYAWYDPQKRLVIHPWERFNGTNTKHYPDFKYVQNEVANPKEVFFPTEFMHGLFDGGHGAALEDFWNEMMKHPYFAGGFLWALHDEGIVRADQHDSIDVAGTRAPDGIVGPHREKEGSYYTIKELWSPVYINSSINPRDKKGRIEIHNRYFYTNFNQCTYQWSTVSFSGDRATLGKKKIMQTGRGKLPFTIPGGTAVLQIPGAVISNADALYLSVFNAKGDNVCTWSWQMNTPVLGLRSVTAVAKSTLTSGTTEGKFNIVINDGIVYTFDRLTGFLSKVNNGKKDISFSGGPALAGSQPLLLQLKSYQQDETYIIEPIYKDDSLKVKWTFKSGTLPKMEYSYKARDTSDYLGITFTYPENKINGMKWLGRGPYHVWKNRLKGQQFNVWSKAYNNTITGENWNYPEFKGWHSEVNWVQVQNTESDFIVYTESENIYLQMLQPEKAKASTNNNTSPAFPGATLGFMHAISAIGTKFQKAEVMGPQSQKNLGQRNINLTGTLRFDFK